MCVVFMVQKLRTDLRRNLESRDAWEMTKSFHKLQEKDKAAFSSPSKNWCLPASSSMYMPSRKDLSLEESETNRVTRNPTTVRTATGEVQTNEEATVYVYDFDLFLTEQILEETPAVLSLGKLCEDHGYFFWWTTGQKPHLI